MVDDTTLRDEAALREAATETVQEGVDIRARMQELTLNALRSRRFDRHAMRDVVRAVTEGAAKGAERTGGDMRQAISEALKGLDQAMRTSAEAGYAALKQLSASGRSFSDAELKQALANLRKMEDDLLATAEQVADGANARVRPELRAALSTMRHTGTATGKQVAQAMGDFAQKLTSASFDAALLGMERAAEFGHRFSQVASGILGGMAEALRHKTEERRSMSSDKR